MKSKGQIQKHLQELYEDREKYIGKYYEGDYPATIEDGILDGWIEALEYVLVLKEKKNET